MQLEIQSTVPMMTDRPLRVLLFGKDGRTDAIAEGIRSSAMSCELSICAPFASPGLAAKADHFASASLTDLEAMVRLTRQSRADLVVVGPEDPLAAGLSDAVAALGVACFGPTQELARVETSKSWTRSLLDRHGIDGNPRHQAFRHARGLWEYLNELGAVVVKPDGLTGGKGVKVQGEQLASHEEALAYGLALLEADGSVVIEERLDGEEFSLQTITDGETFVHCPIAQDHKRAFEGDTGPNTGGMGSYSCPDGSLPFLSDADVSAARLINEAVVHGLGREVGQPYRGVLYGGFMATAGGVALIEYNARFGDPEAMNVLPLMSGGLLELLWATAQGRLGAVDVAFSPRATVCKYVVPDAYPDEGGAGAPIATDESLLGPDLRCYWASAELADDLTVRMTGSRAVAFVGIGSTTAEAERLAERGASSVVGAVRHRRDIGTSGALARRVDHLARLRGAPSPTAAPRHA